MSDDAWKAPVEPPEVALAESLAREHAAQGWDVDKTNFMDALGLDSQCHYGAYTASDLYAVYRRVRLRAKVYGEW